MYDEQATTPSFTAIQTFTVPTYTTTISTGIADGGIYRLRWYATNQFGSSAVSNELSVAATP